jgi:hypothetical protein
VPLVGGQRTFKPRSRWPVQPALQQQRHGVRVAVLMDGVGVALVGTAAAPLRLVVDGDDDQWINW